MVEPNSMCRLTTTTVLVLFVYSVPIMDLILRRRTMQLPTPAAELSPPIVALYNGELPRAMAILVFLSLGTTRSPLSSLFRSSRLLVPWLLEFSILARPAIRCRKLPMLPRSRPILSMFRLIRLVALPAMAVAWPMCMPASSRKLARVMMMNIVMFFSRECPASRPFMRSDTTLYSHMW